MEKNKIKISVIVPTCNRPELLPDTINSLLKQTWREFEIIIVDDGTEKRADKAVSEFAPEDKRPVGSGDTFSKDGIRFTYIQHEKNCGSPVAKNTGIKKARGQWVAFLDDDDEYMPDNLAKRWAVVEKYGDKIGYIYSGIEFFNIKTGESTTKKMKLNGLGNFYEYILPFHLKPITSTVMVRKDVLDEADGFDDNTPANQEMDLLFRIGNQYMGYGMDDIIVRMKGEHGPRMGTDIERRIRGKKYFLDKHFNILKQHPKALAEHYYILADIYRQKRDYKNAREYYLKAYQTNNEKTKAMQLYLLLTVPLLYRLAKVFKK